MTPNLNDLADRLESFIPRGDGYNSDYANTLTEAVEVLRAKAAPKSSLTEVQDSLYYGTIDAPTEPTEAVEVVGYLNTVTGDVVKYGPTLMDWDDEQEPVEPLMTVAQHKRLMATKDGDVVKVPRGSLDRLMTLATKGHYTCEDRWYSCPLSEDGCADERYTECNCGADAHNTEVEQLRALLGGAG